MKKGNVLSKFDLRLVLALTVYLILGLSLIQYYRYQINPDGTSYISVAQKYLNGDFANAINGYWGPMISWLLMPFLCFISDALLAGKVLSLFTGAITIIALHSLSYRFKISEYVRTVILASAVPVILSFAFADITPDLLLTTVLLFYFAVLFSPIYAERTINGILSGVLGGLAYLTKSFAFPFFIAHFFLMNAAIYLRSQTKQDKKKVLRNFLAGALAFALISGVWIGLISNKYGELTSGTSGKTAYKFRSAPGTQGDAYLAQGFIEPPSKTAVNIWEDPTYLEIPELEQVDFATLARNQLKVTARLIKKIGTIFMDFSLFSIAIGIAYLLFWIRRFNKSILHTISPEVLYPTLVIAIYAGGYSLVYVVERYLWLLCAMLMLMGGYVLSRLFQKKFFPLPVRILLLIIFFLSFTIPAYGTLKSYAHRGESMYRLSEVLKNRIPPGSNIASNASWSGTLYLSFHLGCKSYGVHKPNISEIELKKELSKYDIDYYILWGRPNRNLSFLADYQEVTAGRIGGIRIFNVKKRK